ncbi:DUF4190 domain-containing protein [Heyndrickxia sp. NPDC080065]|uniref:DUF4190 domain-containing protein n=1 Tax=Heyndrickxia sp. NPDC080065 TaxID=3390568 RepID=UPI003D03D39A
MVEKAQTNSKSVISLTLGILSIIIPIIGLLLGVIGLVISRISIKEIEETNENGRGLATSGFICSIIGIIIHSVWIFLVILSLYLYTNVRFELQFIFI